MSIASRGVLLFFVLSPLLIAVYGPTIGSAGLDTV